MADENNITTLAKRLRPFMKMAAQEMVPVTPYEHGDLTGLSHDDHLQYIHNTEARTITAQHTFSPGSAAAPFLLGANAQGQTVTGLRADQLNKSVIAGDGLTGGGGLIQDVNLALNTPGTLSVSSTNNAAGSHTHAITSSSNPGAAVSLLSSDASGFLTLVRLKTDSIQDKSGANLTLNPAGDIILNPTGNDVLPYTNYLTNIGAINKKYLMIHAAELWVETLVAQDTLATIGGRVLIGPTTYFTRDVGITDTTIYVRHNQMESGDFAYMEADGKVEWIHISSAPTYIGPNEYSYTCTRNLDGSGENYWYAGDAIFNTGSRFDGYIDLYSMRSIRSDAQIGPTIVGNVRWGTGYSQITETWAIGNLNGLYGYGVDTSGIGLGEYATGSSFITVDYTNGIRMHQMNDSGVDLIKGQWYPNGEIIVGEVGSGLNNILITPDYLKIRNNTTARIEITAAGVFYIRDPNGTERISMGSSGILYICNSAGQEVFTFDASQGAEFTRPLTLGTNGGIWQGEGTFDNPVTGMKFYVYQGKAILEGYNGGVSQWYVNSDGKLYAGSGTVRMDINGISLKASTEYTRASDYSFEDGSGNYLGGLRVYYYPPDHTIHLNNTSDGHNNQTYIQVDSDATHTAQIKITAFGSGGTQMAAIYMDGATGCIGMGRYFGDIGAKLDIYQGNGTGGNEVLGLKQADVDVGFINFTGTSAADKTRSLSTGTSWTLGGAIAIYVNNVKKWIPYYT